MKLGLTISKIEKHLEESYIKQTFETEIKNFKNIVLNNKMLSECFYLYTELNKNKGLDKETAKEFIEESVKILKDKVEHIDLSKVNNWVSSVNTKNNYEHIDHLVTSRPTQIEETIKIKKDLIKLLSESKETDDKSFTPFVENVVKYNIEKYIDSLDPQIKEGLDEILSMTDDDLKREYETLKENTITKLKSQMVISESDVKTTIENVIMKIENDECDKYNFVKLQSLYESL
jgi:hypothetical protein